MSNTKTCITTGCNETVQHKHSYYCAACFAKLLKETPDKE